VRVRARGSGRRRAWQRAASKQLASQWQRQHAEEQRGAFFIPCPRPLAFSLPLLSIPGEKEGTGGGLAGGLARVCPSGRPLGRVGCAGAGETWLGVAGTTREAWQVRLVCWAGRIGSEGRARGKGEKRRRGRGASEKRRAGRATTRNGRTRERGQRPTQPEAAWPLTLVEPMVRRSGEPQPAGLGLQPVHTASAGCVCAGRAGG